MPIPLSQILFMFGTAAYIIIRAIFSRKAAAAAKSIDKSTLLDKALVVLVGVGQIGIPLLFLATPWLAWADYRSADLATWLGGAAMLAGLWLFWRSHADLGKNWSVTLELSRSHRLITHGVYHAIRHPMYASFFVMGMAQALLLANAVAGCSALVAVALLYAVRKPHEEAMMLEHFGAEYQNYMQKTGGVLPRFTGK